jgi:hypothetical protein
MALREEDVIDAAIIATEKEIAGGAWDQDESDADASDGDRSLEEMGEGLEGQHEPEDEDESEDEESDGEEESEGEGEADEAAVAAAAAAKPKEGEGEPPKPVTTEQPQGRVPSGRLREANERLRAAEAERDAFKAAVERERAESKAQLDLVMREIAALKTAPRADAKPPEPPKPVVAPDIFENPTGFVDHITSQFQQQLAIRDKQIADQRLETSMAIAHTFHKDAFEKAWTAVNALSPQEPETRTIVERIKASPNPGEALMTWHKRNETLARVGSDPTAYEERIRTETREALMKDPEFRKQLIADLKGDAIRGDNGLPRTTTRVPPSLHRASGSNVGVDRGVQQYDDSDQAVAEAAWR